MTPKKTLAYAIYLMISMKIGLQMDMELSRYYP
jgi:hypothetical protein